MRRAEPDELKTRTRPLLTARLSEEELHEWLPVPFEDVDDPYAAPEPSKGALIALDSGHYVVVHYGLTSEQMIVEAAEDSPELMEAFFDETALPRERVLWHREGTQLPKTTALRALPQIQIRYRSGRPHVLVVEDDLPTRHALVRVLEAEGAQIDAAADGEKAVGLLAQHRYDAIVLDIALPKMSGTDVMEYIASFQPDVLASIVVVTGLDVAEVRKLFPTVCATLSKPVMPNRLLDSVRRCFTRLDDAETQAG